MLVASFYQADKELQKELSRLFKESGYTAFEKRDVIARLFEGKKFMTELTIAEKETLIAHLRKEQSGTAETTFQHSEPMVGAYPAVRMDTLPVGTEFYAYEGDWNGRIISIDGAKHLLNFDTDHRINLEVHGDIALAIVLMEPVTVEQTVQGLSANGIRAFTKQVREDVQNSRATEEDILALCDILDSALELGQ